MILGSFCKVLFLVYILISIFFSLKEKKQHERKRNWGKREGGGIGKTINQPKKKHPNQQENIYK